MGDFKPKSRLKRFADRLFGYDYFISYAWKDGRDYSVKMATALEEHGFDVFLDSKSYSRGDDWKQIGSWALNRTGQLILIATDAARESGPVKRELEIFSKTGRRIIPIDFGDIQSVDQGDDPFKEYLPDEILRILEDRELSSGPSENTINKIIESFDLRRQSQKRLIWLSGALLILLMTTLLSIFFAVDANNKNRSLLDEQRINRAQLLLANSENLANAQNQRMNLSSLLAMKSYELDASAEALNRMRKNLAITPLFERFISFPSKRVFRFNLSVDDALRRVVLLSDDGVTVSVSDLSHKYNDLLVKPDLGADFRVLNTHDAQLSPNGNLLAVTFVYVSRL
ncbi:MAG: toll/interleukin-1 receptor domain-containing protein, partial [Pseudomonadota bacterium]